MSLSDVCWLLFLGVVCTAVAFLVNIEIVKKLGVFTVSLSINLEPVYTILLAVVLLDENTLLSPKFYIGAGVIILVLLTNAMLKNTMGKKTLI
jgi:drug/metabolite transporter (DMT)-like permease